MASDAEVSKSGKVVSMKSSRALSRSTPSRDERRSITPEGELHALDALKAQLFSCRAHCRF